MRIWDPGWKKSGSGIRDPRWKNSYPGSGIGKFRIRDKHPGFATLGYRLRKYVHKGTGTLLSVPVCKK
jgi:hypothetical protein